MIKRSMHHVTTPAVVVMLVSLSAALPALAADMLPAINQPMAVSGNVTPPVVVGTAFTYQGRLLTSGSPADGLFDLSFRLMDAAGGGTQIGATFVVDNAVVADGRFTVELNFGTSAFGNGARWLEISVRPGAGGAYTLLSPRQKLNPAPYALAMPNVYSNETSGFVGIGRSTQITSNESFGVQTPTGAGIYGGMYINTMDATGWPFYGYATGGLAHAWTYLDGGTSEWHLYNGGDRLFVPSGGGLEIQSTSTTDGLRINATSDDGAQIGNATDYPNYGVYIPSPGVPNTCLLIATAQVSGNYALFTSDNIAAGNVAFTAQNVFARVDGPDALTPGDVVVASGVDRPLDGGTNRLALVRRAGRDASGVIGVVASRMEWQVAPGKETEHEMILMPTDGPARSGDYVELVTQGVTDVRVQRGAAIAKGARLTASDTDGGVRALRVVSINGMSVSESAPVVGVALADASGRDTVPVFVNIH